VANERPKRSGIQLCYPFEEKRLAKWEPPYIVQPKLDGERCRLLNDGRTVLLLSSTEEIITSVPHINELASHALPVGEWDGELYVHGWTFEEIHSVVSRSVNLHHEYYEMQFHIFDHVSDHPQFERTLALRELQTKLEHSSLPFRIVDSYLAHNLDDVMLARTAFVTQGYEGIIVRHAGAPYVRKRSTSMMKFKPKKADAYLIVGTIEEIDKYGNPKGTLGALVCRGDDGTEFKVGSGFTAAQRADLWLDRDHLKGLYVKVEYQALTPGRGCPRFPIFCSIIDDSLAALVEQHRSLR
jgi:DNA ligase-1